MSRCSKPTVVGLKRRCPTFLAPEKPLPRHYKDPYQPLMDEAKAGMDKASKALEQAEQSERSEATDAIVEKHGWLQEIDRLNSFRT